MLLTPCSGCHSTPCSLPVLHWGVVTQLHGKVTVSYGVHACILPKADWQKHFLAQPVGVVTHRGYYWVVGTKTNVLTGLVFCTINYKFKVKRHKIWFSPLQQPSKRKINGFQSWNCRDKFVQINSTKAENPMAVFKYVNALQQNSCVCFTR